MKQGIRFLAIFILLLFATSLSFCSFGAYQAFSSVSKLLNGADNYTCRQFIYEIETPETEKTAALAIATAAYGLPDDAAMKEAQQTEVMEHGMEPAVRKIYAMCKANPTARVINLFAADVTGISPTVVVPVSATAVISPTNAK